MKVIFDEHDKQYIEKINTALEEGETGLISPVQQKGRKYYLEFECTDIGKASAFVSNFLFGKPEERDELEDSLGIKVHCLNYSISNKNDITMILQEAISKINNL